MDFKYTKESVIKLKNAIKDLASEQKDLKNQRKTVNLIGERTTNPGQAFGDHRENRIQLMHMYIAYTVMRNKALDAVMPKDTEKFSQSKVDKIIDKYGEAICISA